VDPLGRAQAFFQAIGDYPELEAMAGSHLSIETA
jgi:hypothetical protein